MNVQFFVLQQHSTNGKTREKRLFSQNRSFIQTGESFFLAGVSYKIATLQWENNPEEFLKAVCYMETLGESELERLNRALLNCHSKVIYRQPEK